MVEAGTLLGGLFFGCFVLAAPAMAGIALGRIIAVLVAITDRGHESPEVVGVLGVPVEKNPKTYAQAEFFSG